MIGTHGSETRSLAARKLDEAIHARMVNANTAIERVFNTIPQDDIVRAAALHFVDDGVLTMTADADHVWRLHRHALQQVSERASVPMTYTNHLSAGEPWQRELLADIFTRTYRQSSRRHLIRAVPLDHNRELLEARGFLSDRFRRLDARPLLEAFVDAARSYGAVPYDGVATDIRVHLKAMLPRLFEPFSGEYIGLGIEWSNSDYGAARLMVRAFILRLMCVNGAVTEDLMREVHLGGRLPEDIVFSQQTYQKDTETMVLATGDVVKAALGDGVQDRLLNSVNAANEREVSVKDLKTRLASALSKDELRRVEEAFTGPDVVNLPPGNTAWRASNALSWVAQTVEDPERRLDFERYAGALLTGTKVDDAQANGNGD